MGSNFHTPWDANTLYKPALMNPPLSDLDRAISYMKNAIVHCDGRIHYNAATGVLTWTGTFRILFVRADGQSIQNTVAASNITLSDNEFAYVDLSETNDAVLTMQKAAVTTAAASNFKAYNRIVFGYRNTSGDRFYPVHLRIVEEDVVALASGAAVTVYWNLGKTQSIVLGHDVAFTFSGGIAGDRFVFRVKQDGTGGRNPTWPATVRYGSDIPAIVLTSTALKTDYLGFIYHAADGKYDLVSHVKGF